MNNVSFIDRHMTNILKGIAVIFMFVHHMFTFPRWYIDSISYPELKDFASFFCSPFKLCVGMFALKRPIMCFCWYVYFYIVAMLILPLLIGLTRNNPIRFALGGIVVMNYLCSLLLQCLADDIARNVVSDFRTWFPCIVIGYLFAQLDIYHRIFETTTKLIKSKCVLVIFWTAMVVISFVSRHYNAYQNIGKISWWDWHLNLRINMDIIYVPIFIYGVVKLIKLIPFERPLHILSELGKYSAYMWFWHCIFFNVCKEYTQHILYFLKQPLLVTICGICICYILSRIWGKSIIQV